MICPQCGEIAESDSADIGVGTLVRGNFHCDACGWAKPAEEQVGLIEDDDPFGLGA